MMFSIEAHAVHGPLNLRITKFRSLHHVVEGCIGYAWTAVDAVLG